MDINSISAQTTNVSAGTSVLKKALDLQSQTAMILIDSIAQAQLTPAVNLPPHLGQNINTTVGARLKLTTCAR